MMTRQPSPTWWQLLTVPVWQAVALSLDIDPHAVKRVHVKAAEKDRARRDDKIGRMAQYILDTWTGPAVKFHEAPEFHQRLELAMRDTTRLPTVTDEGGESDPSDRYVRLPEFASLALLLGWQIPDALKQLAGSSAARRAVPVAEQQAREVLSILRALGKDPRALPRGPAGRPGIKDEVRKRTKLTAAQVDRAWKQLSKSREIGYATNGRAAHTPRRLS
jgi:hypothetical protein